MGGWILDIGHWMLDLGSLVRTTWYFRDHLSPFLVLVDRSWLDVFPQVILIITHPSDHLRRLHSSSGPTHS